MAADGAIKEISYNMSRMIRSEILYTDLLQWYNAPTSTGEYLSVDDCYTKGFPCVLYTYHCAIRMGSLRKFCLTKGSTFDILPHKSIQFWGKS